jgi:subtilisin family serine protease
MHIGALDIKSLARDQGPHRPSHPLLPHPVIGFTQYWLNLGEGDGLPQWSTFDLMDLGENAPHLTVLKINTDNTVDVEFVGSAVTALVGEDFAGMSASADKPMICEIDWYNRAIAAADQSDIQVGNGKVNPPYTSEIEYVSADFPFRDDDGHITHVVCVTVAKLN